MKKLNTLVLIIDSLIYYFIIFVFLGNLLNIITEPLISNNLGKISLGAFILLIILWIYSIFAKKKINLF